MRRPWNSGVSKARQPVASRHYTSLLLFLLIVAPSFGGPPFVTDDPEPVEYRCCELFFASQITGLGRQAAGTAPHIEINYGLVPDVQVSLTARLFFNAATVPNGSYGPGDLELGVKYRFIHETASLPQVSFYPSVQLPTGDSSRGLGLGVAQLFLPFWLQKSFGQWTTYGGGGYIVDCGKPLDNAWLFGWETQRDFSKTLTLGAELFTVSRQQGYSAIEVAFNGGAIVNITEHNHFMIALGRDIVGINRFSMYVAYQNTLGPHSIDRNSYA